MSTKISQKEQNYRDINRERVAESRARTASEKKQLLKQLVPLDLEAIMEGKPVTTKPEAKSISELPGFYQQIADELHLELHEQYTKDAIEERMKHYVGLTLKNLNACRTLWQERQTVQLYLKSEKIYETKLKAYKILQQQFGHPDAATHIRLLEPRQATVEDLSSFWLEAMKSLRVQGFPYYESKLASDEFVFIDGTGDLTDPYQYRQEGNPLFLKSLSNPQFLYNREIIEWRSSETDQTKQKEDVLLAVDRIDRLEEQVEAQFTRKLKEWLIASIKAGFSESHIKRECTRRKYSEAHMTKAIELWHSLLKEGYKPLQPLKMFIVEQNEEEPEKPLQDIMDAGLDQQFIDCIEGYVGTPPSDKNVAWEKPDFEKTILFCTKQVSKDDYAQQVEWQPSPSLLTKAKHFWSPNYRPEPKPRAKEKKKDKTTIKIKA